MKKHTYLRKFALLGLFSAVSALAQSGSPANYTLNVNYGTNDTKGSVTFANVGGFVGSTVQLTVPSAVSQDLGGVYAGLGSYSGTSEINGINGTTLTGAYGVSGSITTGGTINTSLGLSAGVNGTISEGQTSTQTITWSFVEQTDGLIHIQVQLTIQTSTGSYTTSINYPMQNLTVALVNTQIIPPTNAVPAPAPWSNTSPSSTPSDGTYTSDISTFQTALNFIYAWFDVQTAIDVPSGTVWIGACQVVPMTE